DDREDPVTGDARLTAVALVTHVALRAGRAGLALRTGGADCSRIALRAGRTGGSGSSNIALRTCGTGSTGRAHWALRTGRTVYAVAAVQRTARGRRQLARTERSVLDVHARHRAVLDVRAPDEHLLCRECAGRDRQDQSDEAAGGKNLLQVT